MAVVVNKNAGKTDMDYRLAFQQQNMMLDTELRITDYQSPITSYRSPIP
jgi:hypothetical protein